MLNQFLAKRYRVVQTLGEGGLAKTYIAEDHFQPSHPKCVVKLLKPASNDTSFLPIARRLFIKEAEILEQLGMHPQIPQLLAHFEEKKAFLIIQEFIEGHTLSTELPAGHCWSENKVVLMLQDVLKTLEFVHSYGVIHRDVKPNNLIRRYGDGRLVLIDFGAVKQIGDLRITTKTPMTPKTISIGTQGYMPTEQARGKPRLNSDLYALGMICIQALTGIDPLNLQEDVDGEVVWQDQAQVNHQLASVISKMVCYHFRDRYQTATEVLQALEKLGIESQSSSINSQQKSVTAPDITIRSTKVSLDHEHSEIKITAHDVLEQSVISQEVHNSITKKTSEQELKETKISLDHNHLDIKTSSPASFRKAEKTPIKDIWSSWDLQADSINSKKLKISVDKQQTNQVNTSKLLKTDSWDMWNSQAVAQYLQDNHSDLEKTSQVKLNKSLTVQETNQANTNVVSNAQLGETKISLKNEYQNPQVISQPKSQATKLSRSNKYLDSFNRLDLQIFFNTSFKQIQAFLLDQTINIRIFSNQKTKQIGLLLNNSLQKLVEQYNSKDLKSIEKNLNSFYLTLAQFYKINRSNLTPGKEQKKILLIILGLVLAIISLHTVYSSIKQKKSQSEEIFAEMQMLEQSQKYTECIQQVQGFSDLNTQTVQLLNECSGEQLAEAQNLAKQSRLKDAIHLASQIPENTNVHPKAQDYISQWSEQIYRIANNKYQEGDLVAAIAIANTIPADSVLFTKLQAAIKQWNQDWELNKSHLETAQKKLSEQQWQDAIKIAKQIEHNAYWQKQGNSIIQQAETEITAAQKAANLDANHPRFIPGVTSFQDIYIQPNHPINDPNRDWVKEKLGRN